MKNNFFKKAFNALAIIGIFAIGNAVIINGLAEEGPAKYLGIENEDEE